MIVRSMEHVPSDVLTIATDASTNGTLGVIAWVTEAGTWWAYRSRSHLGATHLEMVAVASALRHNIGRVHVQCDNPHVVRTLDEWLVGVDYFLPSLTLGQAKTLEKAQVRAVARTLARKLWERRDQVTVEQVKGHQDQHLNNAADALARTVLRLPTGKNKKQRSGRHLTVAREVEPFISTHRYKTDRLRGNTYQVEFS